jgi:hypothetical protein
MLHLTDRPRVRAALAATLCALALLAEARPQCDQAELEASDGKSGQEFGWATAIDGDRALVGAFGDGTDGVIGSAYAWLRSAAGWLPEGKLLPPPGEAFTGFGQSVAISGDFALVGARYDDHAGTDSGAAFVFRRVDGAWLPDGMLVPADGAAGDEFGQSVAIRGDVAVVGAAGDDDAGSFSGSAWVFRRVAGAWTAEAKLTASEALAGDGFGASVDVDVGVAVVGAPGADGAVADAGCAWVFDDGATGWTQAAKLVAADGTSFDGFGFDVAIRDDTLAAGAPGAGVSGSAYVFRRNAGVWSQQARLAPGDPSAGQQFGFSVAIAADGALVGAFGDDQFGTQSGAAYWFESDGSRWTEELKITDASPEGSEYFGFSVALSGARLLVGCPDDHEPSFAFGSASFLALDAASWWNFGSGWPGTGSVPGFTLSGPPSLGASVTIEAANSSGADSQGLLFFGFEVASLVTGKGGTLLVAPAFEIPLTIPSSGLLVPVTIPALPALCGLAVFGQALQVDPGASKGVSFSAGLGLMLGGD